MLAKVVAGLELAAVLLPIDCVVLGDDGEDTGDVEEVVAVPVLADFLWEGFMGQNATDSIG